MGGTSKKTTVFSQATPSDSFVLGPSGYGAKNATFYAIHSYIKMHHLTKTGSGQT